MKKFIDKICDILFRPKKTSLFWLYFVCGVLLVLLGIMLMPVWSGAPDWVFWRTWGYNCVDLIICACIVLYLGLFLFKKIKSRSNGVIKVLTIIEFVIMALIALGCLLSQFEVINIKEACKILGLALWCRGVVEIFRAYYHQRGNNYRYPVWWLVVSIFFVTAGTWMFVKPFFTNTTIVWIFSILMIVVGIIVFVDGFLAKPAAKAKKTSSKSTKNNKED